MRAARALPSLAALVVTAAICASAHGQGQTASATGACSIAVAASGHAVVNVQGACDAREAQTVTELSVRVTKLEGHLRQSRGESRAEALQRQLASDKRTLSELAAAVADLKARAEARQAPPPVRAAFAALPQDVMPAVTEL